MNTQKYTKDNWIKRPRTNMLFKLRLLPICLLFYIFLLHISVNAQEHPPKPIIVVTVEQHLNFGTFIQGGNSGSVSVNWQGIRTSLNIILPSISSATPPSCALFRITALPGTLITINAPSATFLNGSNGGQLVLTFNLATDCSKGSSFVVTNETTDVTLGGTLTVDPLITDHAGNYSGDFQITFIQQ